MTTASLGPVARVDGEVDVPGDKSISHRALILGALAQGRSRVRNLSPSADVASTSECLRRCKAWARVVGEGEVQFEGAGAGRSLHQPETQLDCGNSGTTMRLLGGALAGHDLLAVLTGDRSLRRRPMERVGGPLRAMGAEFTTTGGTAPVTVRGRRRLTGMEHVMEVPSAQVKSAILLAGLSGDGGTTVIEPVPTRDHTERLLRLTGIHVAVAGPRISLTPGRVGPFDLRVPGDLSSAAFFLALAAARPGWRVRCRGVTANPGRTGILDVLKAMGATLEVSEGASAGGVEPCADVEVRGAQLRATVISGALVARCIDELPLLAVLASQAEGITEIRDAAELRVKESDRISTVAAGLTSMGVRCDVFDDGLAIHGPARLQAARLDAAHDHRLAMAWSIAACLTAPGSGETRISGSEAAAVSYPGFFSDLDRLVASS